jgi:hypothetical protein
LHPLESAALSRRTPTADVSNDLLRVNPKHLDCWIIDWAGHGCTPLRIGKPLNLAQPWGAEVIVF